MSFRQGMLLKVFAPESEMFKVLVFEYESDECVRYVVKEAMLRGSIII